MCAGHTWSNGVSMLSLFLEFVVRLWYSSDIVVFISSFYRPTTTPTTPPPLFPQKRRVWLYQRGNQNPYIEEEKTTQWPKEKGQTTSTKHTHKTKDRKTRTPLKTGGELMCLDQFSLYIRSPNPDKLTIITIQVAKANKICVCISYTK